MLYAVNATQLVMHVHHLNRLQAALNVLEIDICIIVNVFYHAPTALKKMTLQILASFVQVIKISANAFMDTKLVRI